MRISFKNIPWKKRLSQTVWLLLGMGAMVLFGAAMIKKNQKKCTGIQIEIAGATQHMFLDEKDILELLNLSGKMEGNAIGKINLRILEQQLEMNSWIKNAEMYFDNQQVLQVKILERQPIARVFVNGGGSFYLDTAGLRLPLSEKLSARVPVFTNFPSNRTVLAKPDSNLLGSIVKLASFIQTDSFWMAQIAQININSQSNFELIPLVGDQLILLGDTTSLEKKFGHLSAFYQQAFLQKGINTYEKLDLRYDNQVVAIRRGTEKAVIDSAEAKKRILELTAKTNNEKTTYQTNNKTINKPLTKGHKSNMSKSVH
ncbi:MAG: hypothetical protein K2Q21_02390 [Chitinophagaceae bacterium]|nr:hypothetical protein [Chitinophagaceae bacterium]